MVNTDPVSRARPKISLTTDEELYLSQVHFDPLQSDNSDRQRSLAAASSLAKSVLGRGGVPKIRWRYFTDRELNVGAAMSREELLEAKGISPSGILTDPAFLPVLHYWIYGPQLPQDIISWFMVAVAHGTDLRALRRSVRQAVRENGLPQEEVAEEFYRLALEAGLDSEAAWSIRNAVYTIRPRQPMPVQMNREEEQR